MHAPAWILIVAALLAWSGSEAQIYECAGKDGSRVFIEGSVWALHDATGRFRGTIKIGQDITERRRSEEALKVSENQAKLLVAELQHRVRNTLAVVRSIAQRTAWRTVGD